MTGKDTALEDTAFEDTAFEDTALEDTALEDTAFGDAFFEERGETLIELLVALAIMGIALVAVIGGLGASIVMSDIHRKQATAGAAVRNYAELVANYVAGTGYSSCAATSAYAPGTVGFTAPSGYTASAASIRYWTGSAWSASCGSDTGLQQLTVVVSSTDTRASEQLVLVLRKPCGTGSSC